MRTLFVNLSVLLFLFSCSKSPEETSQFLIQDYLKNTMKDWESYESVKFGSLDSAFTIYTDTQESIFEMKKIDSINNISSDFQNRANENISAALKVELLDSAIFYNEMGKKLLNEYNRKLNSFKGEFNGWKMEHTFRGNNSYGAKTIETMLFYFDKDITRITSSYNQND